MHLDFKVDDLFRSQNIDEEFGDQRREHLTFDDEEFKDLPHYSYKAVLPCRVEVVLSFLVACLILQCRLRHQKEVVTRRASTKCHSRTNND